MPNKMLIDASHPEETRVVVVHGNRIEEFDFESQDKKQLKGNIYLARVTRVEPSLQAAFVEYGGNRHGFLAFSEIHPDYYQIPVADRQALLRAEAEAEEDDDDDAEGGDDRQDRGRGRRRRRGRNRGREDGTREAASDDAAGAGEGDQTADETEAGSEAEEVSDDITVEETVVAVAAESADDTIQDEADAAETTADADAEVASEETPAKDDRGGSIAAAVEADVISEELPAREDLSPSHEDAPAPADNAGGIEELPDIAGDDNEIESVGAGDALEEVQARRKPMRRQYKIQEVIKRRQILLVQVVKEERGNKGAALTTYLSLAGRYSVLMPNTARGGGISRKITNAQDRKRLKEVVQDLEVPQGMGVILRTAGESRTKAEIKRDYEYLMRLWENVRTLTLQSTAPALVYEEGSLIKRSVRDLYNKDIDEIQVAGDEGYREAKDFMRMLMPSHAKVVQPYRDNVPLFVRHGIEAQLDRMLQPQVTLKSGGYIIINQTEALVSIDVNSGRSTREHSIEETALHTNLEAAEEVARQLRLRDLAGLIVIDFIDMEENRNNRSVEKRLKEHLKNDRARIQLGRISHFGLMEMSRQRIRASVLESTMKPCPHCGGTGHVRSDSSVALLVVRAIEEFLLKDSRSHIIVKAPAATAMYVLNHKRSTLTEMEARFGLTITIEMDETVGAQHYAIFRGAVAEKPLTPIAAPAGPTIQPEFDEDPVVEEEDDTEEAAPQQAAQDEPKHAGDGEQRRKRKRRRRRGGRDRDHAHPPQPGDATEGDAEHEALDASDAVDAEEAVEADEAEAEAGDAVSAQAEEAAADGERKKRRRGKRGGRRHRDEEDATEAAVAVNADSEPDAEVAAEAVAVEVEEASIVVPAEEAAPVPAEAPKKGRRTSTRKKAADKEAAPAADESPAKPAKRTRKKAAAEAQPAAAETVSEVVTAPEPAEEPVAEQVETPSPAVVEAEPAPRPEPVAAEPDRPKKSGWWQRKGFF